jgi:hypothetical protein
MNPALKIRILGRAIILAVLFPILWFALDTLQGNAHVAAFIGLFWVAFLSSLIVDELAKRKKLPSPSEIEKY